MLAHRLLKHPGMTRRLKISMKPRGPLNQVGDRLDCNSRRRPSRLRLQPTNRRPDQPVNSNDLDLFSTGFFRFERLNYPADNWAKPPSLYSAPNRAVRSRIPTPTPPSIPGGRQ